MCIADSDSSSSSDSESGDVKASPAKEAKARFFFPVNVIIFSYIIIFHYKNMNAYL
jgi:hypothetical protein